MDIANFCADEDGRFPLSKPWVKDGWRYATDARITVREPTTEPNTENRTETIEPLFGLALSRAARDVLAVVPTHDGKAKTTKEPACMLVENPTKETCPKVGNCEAKGDHECTKMADYRVPASQRFADHKWQGLLIELINEQLPGARYFIGQKGYMYFFAGDVEGILAPMKD